MAKGLLYFFTLLISLQLLWGFIITGIVYTIPAEYQQYTSQAQNAVSKTPEALEQNIETSLETQSRPAVTDIGALVVHTGSLAIDLLANAFLALPELLTLLLTFVFAFVPIDAVMASSFKQLVMGIGTALYSISLIILLLNLRSQGTAIL